MSVFQNLRIIPVLILDPRIQNKLFLFFLFFLISVHLINTPSFIPFYQPWYQLLNNISVSTISCRTRKGLNRFYRHNSVWTYALVNICVYVCVCIGPVNGMRPTCGPAVGEKTAAESNGLYLYTCASTRCCTHQPPMVVVARYFIIYESFASYTCTFALAHLCATLWFARVSLITRERLPFFSLCVAAIYIFKRLHSVHFNQANGETTRTRSDVNIQFTRWKLRYFKISTLTVGVKISDFIQMERSSPHRSTIVK